MLDSVVSDQPLPFVCDTSANYRVGVNIKGDSGALLGPEYNVVKGVDHEFHD